MPAREVMEDISRTEELDAVGGTRASAEGARLNTHLGPSLPTQLKTRTQQGQHMHGKGLPDPFSTTSICGNLVAAAAEHPKELSPQSALQKKTPGGLNGQCHSGIDGSSNARGPCTQLHLGSTPLSQDDAPPTEPTNDALTKGLQLRGVESRQFQTEINEKDPNTSQQASHKDWLGDEAAQHLVGGPERIRSILSQEELLEGAEKNIEVAKIAEAGYGVHTGDMERRKDGQSTTYTMNPEMRILRSMTVAGPVLNTSRIPRDIPLRRETTAVQWNSHKTASPSVDSSRGRRKTGTLLGCQSARRTQSDARGLCPGDVNLLQTSIKAFEIRAETFLSSGTDQRRAISASRRSPQRHKENLITRKTPENHPPGHSVPPPFGSGSQEGVMHMSPEAENASQQLGREKQIVSNERHEGYTITTSDRAANSLGGKETASILLPSSGRSTSQKQVCQDKRIDNREQGHFENQLAMKTTKNVNARIFRHSPLSAFQKRKTARKACGKPHKQHQSFSSQLHKRLNRRPATMRMKSNDGGREVVLRHTGQQILRKVLCTLGKYEEATPNEQGAATGRVLKDSICNISSVKGSHAASRIGILGDNGHPEDKVIIGAYLKTREQIVRAQQLGNNCTAFPLQSNSLHRAICQESLVEGTLRYRCPGAKECDGRYKAAAAQNMTTCKRHSMEAIGTPRSPCKPNRRAASCIEPGPHGTLQLQFTDTPCTRRFQRAARSLSRSPGGAEDLQTALASLKQPMQVELRSHVITTCSQPAAAEHTDEAFNKEPIDARTMRSLEEPPHSPEVEVVLGSLGHPDGAATVAGADSTCGDAHATNLTADVKRSDKELSTSHVFQGKSWCEENPKQDSRMDATSATSSQSLYNQRRQTGATHSLSPFPLEAHIIGNAAPSAPLPQKPGAESRARPHATSLGLSMPIQDHFAQVNSTDEAVSASNGVHVVPPVLRTHIGRHTQAMLFSASGERTTDSTNDPASGQPVVGPVGRSESCLWVAPRSVLFSLLDGWVEHTEGNVVEMGDSSKYPGDATLHFESLPFNEDALQTHYCTRQAKEAACTPCLSGDSSNSLEDNASVQDVSEAQKEASALPSVVQPCPAFPATQHTTGRSQEQIRKNNNCPLTDRYIPRASEFNRILRTPGVAGAPGSAFPGADGTPTRAAANFVQSAAGAHHQCRVAICHCLGTWQEHTFCRVPELRSHQTQERVPSGHRRGTLLRRCYLHRALYLKEEELKWRIRSRKKHVQLLNKQLTIQQQQLERELQLQQTQFQQKRNSDNASNNRVSNDRIFIKPRFRRTRRQRRLRCRRARAVYSEERPSTLIKAATAAAAAALAVADACGQRSHKLTAVSPLLPFYLEGSAQALADASQTEGPSGSTTAQPPFLQQQQPLLTAKLRDGALQGNPGLPRTPSENEQHVQPRQDEGLFRSRKVEIQRCVASLQETDDAFNHPSQDSPQGRMNTLQLQLPLPQITQPGPTAKVEECQNDSVGPMLPRAASEPTCPKLAIGLELSFPSPGRKMSPTGAMEYEGPYSQMEMALAPRLPNIRSFPIQKLQTKETPSSNWEGTSGGCKIEPSAFIPYAEYSRKFNNMPMNSTLTATRRSLGRGSRASLVGFRSSSTAIRNSSSRQRRNSQAGTASNKAWDIPLLEGLQGTPGKYRCNAVPMAYHRDPSISIFSQLFEDSFRRERNLLLLRMQNHLGTLSIVRNQRTREGETLQHRAMLAAGALTKYNVTSPSGEFTKIANRNRTVFPVHGLINGSREALKENKVHSGISAKPMDDNTDSNAVSGKPLFMKDTAEKELCLFPGSSCRTVTQSKTDTDNRKCMHVATKRLGPLAQRTQKFGTFVAAMEAESIH